MPGTLNVGGHDIITHSGDAGAGNVTVNVQNRLVLDSSGNVGIGTSSGTEKLKVQSASSGVVAEVSGPNAYNAESGLAFSVGRAKISGFLNSGGATPGTSLRFYTMPDSGSVTERMQIDSSGNVLVGTTSLVVAALASAGNGVRFSPSGIVAQFASNAIATATFNRTSNDGTILDLRKNGTTVGSISTNANSLPSDRNFKKDIYELEFGLDLVKKLKPKTYRYKINDDNSPFMIGLVAQDLEESLLEVGVNQNDCWILQHNENVEDGNSKYQLDYSRLIPILAKAIQEQQTIIESQQSQIDALTARIEALENA